MHALTRSLSSVDKRLCEIINIMQREANLRQDFYLRQCHTACILYEANEREVSSGTKFLLG